KLAVDEELVAARGRLGCAGGGGHRGVLLGRSSRLYDDRSAAGKRARRGGRGGPAPYGLVTGGVGKSSISAIASSLMVRIESTPGGKSRVGRARWSGWDTAPSRDSNASGCRYRASSWASMPQSRTTSGSIQRSASIGPLDVANSS